MSLTEINANDLSKLDELRVERLLQFFMSSLPHCLIQIDASNTMSVYCPHSDVVDELMDELEDLRNHAWLILGVRQITFYFCQEQLLCVNTRSH